MAAFEDVFKPGTSEYSLNLFFFMFFFITICLNFLVDFKRQGSNQNIKDLKQIAEHYIDYESFGLKGQFIYDLLPVIPLEFLPLKGQERRFFLIKLMRIYTGIKIFYVPDIMDKIKKIFTKRLEYIVENKVMEGN